MVIDRTHFMMAYGRDIDFHDAYPRRTSLARHTGDLVWVYDHDNDAVAEGVPAQDNRDGRERVAAEPGRYLQVPGLDHGEHHEVLRKFLKSEWTDDPSLRERAEDAYFRSIAGWKKEVGDADTVAAYNDDRETETLSRAEEFLRQNGIDPQWK